MEKRTIMVADNDGEFLEGAQLLLSAQGFTVITASSPKKPGTLSLQAT